MINSFSGGYRFLSNFFFSPVVLDDIEYRTVEHAYQAAKTHDLAMRTRIRLADTPGEAKRLGRKVVLRPEWETVKLDVMYWLVQQKFSNPALKRLLLATGEAELIEGNSWGDTFWGVSKGVGENHLGRILMRVRDALRLV